MMIMMVSVLMMMIMMMMMMITITIIIIIIIIIIASLIQSRVVVHPLLLELLLLLLLYFFFFTSLIFLFFSQNLFIELEKSLFATRIPHPSTCSAVVIIWEFPFITFKPRILLMRSYCVFWKADIGVQADDAPPPIQRLSGVSGGVNILKLLEVTQDGSIPEHIAKVN